MMREIALDERRLGAAFVARHHKTYFAITAPSRKEPQLLPLRLSLLSGEVVSRHAKQLLSLWPLLPRDSALASNAGSAVFAEMIAPATIARTASKYFRIVPA
jgi:hypothetical protein